MPYYCTVPRCTSMAGKAKNVSFHQFPRDEELAKLWNRILKRGKPYTKYSKVCSLHFKPEDYTITSVGKNKGQWRTLRKDAIPSQNLPSESPAPYTRRNTGYWAPAQPSGVDPMVQQQMAQAIYMQTMLAMQAAGASESLTPTDQPLQMPDPIKPSPSGSSISEIELLLRKDTETPKDVTFKCQECSKCFKDPDVFLLHKRTHKNDTLTNNIEKENYSANIQDSEETLRANPILANLLKTSMRLAPESSISNILTVENQIMTALASNMEAYIRTLSSMLSNQANAETEDKSEDKSGSDDFEDKDDNEESDHLSKERDDANTVECESENENVGNQDDMGEPMNEDLIPVLRDNEGNNEICENQNMPVVENKKHASELSDIDGSYTTEDEENVLIDDNHRHANNGKSMNDNNVREEILESENDERQHEIQNANDDLDLPGNEANVQDEILSNELNNSDEKFDDEINEANDENGEMVDETKLTIDLPGNGANVQNEMLSDEQNISDEKLGDEVNESYEKDEMVDENKPTSDDKTHEVVYEGKNIYNNDKLVQNKTDCDSIVDKVAINC